MRVQPQRKHGQSIPQILQTSLRWHRFSKHWAFQVFPMTCRTELGQRQIFPNLALVLSSMIRENWCCRLSVLILKTWILEFLSMSGFGDTNKTYLSMVAPWSKEHSFSSYSWPACQSPQHWQVLRPQMLPKNLKVPPLTWVLTDLSQPSLQARVHRLISSLILAVIQLIPWLTLTFCDTIFLPLKWLSILLFQALDNLLVLLF